MKSARIFLALILLATFTTVAAKAQVPPAERSAPSSRGDAKTQLVIIDTDIGDDIDDAFALALALRSPELRILGVTTAFGNTELRARLVDRFLKSVGRTDIPVLAGVETKTDNVMTQAAYARQMVQGHKHADGVDFLLKQIRLHPGQITLVAIGPLFNLQEAIKRDPATFKKLRRVVIMGGSIDRGYDDAHTGAHRPPDAEWNINRDPAGGQALFAAGVPIFMMPLDSTQIHLETLEREAIFSHGSALTDQVTLLYHQWMGLAAGHPAAPTLFDPVAVAYAIRPALCEAEPMHIEVDDKGFTRKTEGNPNAEVCLKSNERGFLDFLLHRVAGDR